ncbi:type II toxin-antitoxin system Phd/YefM family antitoxin [Rubellimicrobium sp. CFH 75288]|uniref:type II toxin-antitoxin system Phd/YefM family antitoxin n=1 Tax=Rubellimicrobium sp. CFH 75288 TaxID=2697034 RepID=UPI0014123A9E|nr:type II toxin-antitoxin system Phd/YefM family antitoxin [Rubellimicrobium sp. CFH 75288]NAZ38314.1 type II toxin-antitoxin system prevent-host-death family antitoxin [Rubellimicrobium sp. CFH 75288]
MKAVSAREAKHRFGQLIDEARAEPVVVEKHGRPVVVVLAVEEYRRLTGQAVEPSGKARPRSDATAQDNNGDER